jgi:hypothetical protein
MTGSSFKDATATCHWSTFKVSTAPFHDAPDSCIAECLIRSKGAFFHRTLEFLLKSFDEPVNLQVDTSVDKRVEVAAGVFESKCIRVWKI